MDHPVRANQRPTAIRHYMHFVDDGASVESVWTDLKGQAFLDDEDFVVRRLKRAKASDDVNTPKAQRRAPPPSRETIALTYADRVAAMIAAHATGGYSYQRIADYSGVHFTTAGGLVRSVKPR